MKIWRILAAACALLWCMAACAGAQEADAGLNSAGGRYERMAAYEGCVYAVTTGAPVSRSIVWNITGGNIEEVYSAHDIRCIHAHADGILLMRDAPTLGSLFDKTIMGNVYVELLDPGTGSAIQWAHFPSGETFRRSFARGENVYVWSMDEKGGVLEKYGEPDRAEYVLETELQTWEYPTFVLLDGEKMLFDHSKVRMTIFDTLTGREYDTGRALRLAQSWSSGNGLQAVLQGEALYYLSADGLRAYDFDAQTDAEVISLDGTKYSGFTLSQKYIVFYDSDGETVDVYGAETGEHLTSFSSTVWNGSHVLLDGKIYLYTPYGDGNMEVIDIESGAQTVKKLSQEGADVYWVD